MDDVNAVAEQGSPQRQRLSRKHKKSGGFEELYPLAHMQHRSQSAKRRCGSRCNKMLCVGPEARWVL
ncbi:hypothetical protein NPIL_335051 [Nephila pilipes]|uniref:Uncharacterized protein n=1 Tax=Nephila pilipes TaxID=299642 RepID=A0A8X6NHH5_NEPPI|nr:hypothetical protein NPIL_335051 [Nephila pilipes]